LAQRRQHDRVGAFLLVKLERTSPCKINLLLNVLGKRADGFHELETILYPVRIEDKLEFERGPYPGVELTCSNAALPTDSQNLVVRAARAFFEKTRLQEGIRIHLDKRIPLAAGLGGGSSNAANTLAGLNELFGGPLTSPQLREIAAGLGSDIPFFLQSSPALATGRGAQITPLDSFAAFQDAVLLLIYPGFGISSAWAYQQLSRFPAAVNGTPGRAQTLLSLLKQNDLSKAAKAFYNALEAPALHKFPILAMYQEFLRDQGAAATLMSGSGSTTFALVQDQMTAGKLVEAFKEKFGPRCWMRIVALGS
jgi:4-diphosphocytidyl-2-C-methyl-D-erythritol kinase